MKLDRDNVKEDIENVKEEKEQRQTTLLSSIKPSKGHICYEFNTITKDIREAKFEKTDIDWNTAVSGDYSKLKKIIAKQDCIYITALNKILFYFK